MLLFSILLQQKWTHIVVGEVLKVSTIYISSKFVSFKLFLLICYSISLYKAQNLCYKENALTFILFYFLTVLHNTTFEKYVDNYFILFSWEKLISQIHLWLLHSH